MWRGFFREQGYRAYVLAGGLQGWDEASYPPEAKTAERGRTAAAVCPACGRPLATY